MVPFKKSYSVFSLFLTVLVCLCPQIVSAGPLGLTKIKVGAYDSPPKIYINESGDTVGIFPAVLGVIAEQEGWQIEYVHGTWEQCLQRLRDGSIDILVDIAYSREREKHFSFSAESVILNWGTIYTKKEFTAESFPDLKGITMAVVKEDIHTVGDNGIMSLADKFELDLTYLPVDSYKDALEMVNEGRADAGVVNRLYGAVSENQFDINKSPIVFNPVKLRFAFTRANDTMAFARTIDSHLNKLKKDPDSVFHKIINSYLAGVEYDFSSYYEIKPFKLSDAELAWLRDHQTIRFGVDKSYAPYSYIDRQGEYHGLAVDILDLVARHLGLNIEIVKGLSWHQILAGAKDRRVDAVLTAVETPERKAYLDFTQIYLATPLVIMTRKENDRIEGPEDLYGTKISLVQGYSSADRVLREHPDITPRMVGTPLQGLMSLSAGEVDCYIGVLGVNDYLARQHGISNLKVAARYDMLFYGQGVGVRKDWPELTIILDKAFEALSEKKKIALYQTWISPDALLEGPAALQDHNVLSAEETAWVKKQKTIRLGVDPEFAPFEFYDNNGKYSGIASEYINILNKRLGLDMQVVPDLTWKDAVEKAKDKEIDALPCVGRTEEREGFLNFSAPYLNYSRVIITRSDTPFISSTDDIEKLKVAVQEGSSHEGYLLENTGIKPIVYPTLLSALKSVSAKKADALVGNLSSSIYWIRKENLTNLKVAGPVAYSSEHLHFAARKDWPQLVNIIDKGLSSISPAKEKRIREKWINVEYEPGLNPKIIFRYLVQGVAMVLLILLAIVVWNYRLKKEIERREVLETALHEHQDQLEERIEHRTSELSAANIRLKKEIEDRKQMEKEKEKLHLQLHQAQKMESMGTLAGGIAHDFNNILGAILGYAELVKDDLPRNSSSFDMQEQLIHAGVRAKKLVEQILLFSRQADHEVRPIQPHVIINEALELLRASIPTTIEIKKDLQPDLGSILADPTQIHQIIMNLCTNAYHAMRETNGVLAVSLLKIMIHKDDITFNDLHLTPGPYLLLEVSDTGHGMDQMTVDNIFNPYFTTKLKGEGTGLGLSVVHGIVKNYDGHIKVYSEPGQGTTFQIYFPLITTPDTLLEIQADTMFSTGNEHLLIVDDDKSIVDMMKHSLETLGYQVSAFADSREALDVFQARPDDFDLVITDMTMPRMTGLELTKQLFLVKPDVSIILCTGYSELITKEKASALGIKGFLLKPVLRKDMAETIRKVLDTVT